MFQQYNDEEIKNIAKRQNQSILETKSLNEIYSARVQWVMDVVQDQKDIIEDYNLKFAKKLIHKAFDVFGPSLKPKDIYYVQNQYTQIISNIEQVNRAILMGNELTKEQVAEIIVELSNSTENALNRRLQRLYRFAKQIGALESYPELEINQIQKNNENIFVNRDSLTDQQLKENEELAVGLSQYPNTQYFNLQKLTPIKEPALHVYETILNNAATNLS